MTSWKDTVMSNKQILGVFKNTPNLSDDAKMAMLGGRAVAQAQAEISFKAGQESILEDVSYSLSSAHQKGIREVVEWIQKEGIWAQVPFKGKRKEETMWCLFPEEWQVKLKEWFKDSPELLEKWGIK